MRAAHQEIYSCMDDERKRMNFEGVENIRCKLIVDEPVKSKIYHTIIMTFINLCVMFIPYL